MSGICGILNFDGEPVDRDLLDRMNRYQAFRGPDARGLHVDGPLGLGHTLAKTTEESENEHQPLSLDGSVWIVADARIDGREELAEELRGRGARAAPRDLESATDPELILRAYEAWGIECFDHLLGDFCFAIWDGTRGRLVCAVDRFGVKPLFYARVGRSFAFSNTLDCVRLHPLVRDELADAAVGDFLLFGSYSDPDITIYSDVWRLPPAHALVLHGGDERPKRYWNLPDVPELRLRRPEEYVDRFGSLLDRSVRDRLRTSRVSISLSGGLDSPLVAASATRLLRRRYASFDLTGFTVVYDRLVPDEERRYTSLAAAHLGMPVRFHPADDLDAGDWLARTEWFPPEPSLGLLQGSSLDLMREILAAGPVHLTGYDGDALLGASIPLYWKEQIRTGRWLELARGGLWYIATQRGLPPVGFRTRLGAMLGGAPRPRFPDWLDEDFAKRAALFDRFQAATHPREVEATSRGAARASLEASWAFFLDSYDPAWTHCPLDARHPLLDLRLVTFALGLPAVPWCVGKEILRRCLAGFPAALRSRPKSPLWVDPVVAKVRKGYGFGLDRSPLRDEIRRFVKGPCAFASLAGGEAASIYSGLRVMILSTWLEGRRGRRPHE